MSVGTKTNCSLDKRMCSFLGWCLSACLSLLWWWYESVNNLILYGFSHLSFDQTGTRVKLRNHPFCRCSRCCSKYAPVVRRMSISFWIEAVDHWVADWVFKSFLVPLCFFCHYQKEQERAKVSVSNHRSQTKVTQQWRLYMHSFLVLRLFWRSIRRRRVSRSLVFACCGVGQEIGPPLRRRSTRIYDVSRNRHDQLHRLGPLFL